MPKTAEEAYREAEKLKRGELNWAEGRAGIRKH
jgi:hypothetical protein